MRAGTQRPVAHTDRGETSDDDVQRRLSEYISKKGLRQTPQRRLIVDVFLHAGRHLATEELLAEVRKRNPAIGYATVYRTLRLLAESGIAEERHFGDSVTRYERADTEHHDHLICTECGTITEFEEPRIERLQDAVADKHGWTLETHRLELYGICPECTRKRRPTPPRVRK
ncbi:MAG: transcriptional repressor [Deltaproteobacteria bacterium]|nr:transcriptional repressor [Deltaproteobacteria bacterium]